MWWQRTSRGEALERGRRAVYATCFRYHIFAHSCFIVLISFVAEPTVLGSFINISLYGIYSGAGKTK